MAMKGPSSCAVVTAYLALAISALVTSVVAVVPRSAAVFSVDGLSSELRMLMVWKSIRHV